MSVGRSWAVYVGCPECGAAEGEACKKAKTGESYRGLYQHRARLNRAINAALEVDCPKCGHPETVPCFFSTEYIPGGALISSKDKVHDERARKARKVRREQRAMSMKRDAEQIVGAVRRSDWTTVEGGAWAATNGFTLLRPEGDGNTALYVIHHNSGRLFRSVTKGSTSLTSCSLRNCVHSKWIAVTVTEHDLPGGATMLEREGAPGHSSTGTVEEPTPEGEPEQEPEPEPEPEPLEMNVASFLTPTTRTKRMIVEESTNNLDLSIHDLTRLLHAAGVKISPKRVIARDASGAKVEFPLTLEWIETTEREETDGEW